MCAIEDFGRVVNVNSMLMNQGALDLSAPETIYKVRIRSQHVRVSMGEGHTQSGSQIGRTPPMMRHVPTGYADSKLAAAILNRELAERYKVSVWVYIVDRCQELTMLVGIAEFPEPPVLCNLPRFLQDGAQPRGQLSAPAKGHCLEHFDQRFAQLRRMNLHSFRSFWRRSFSPS